MSWFRKDLRPKGVSVLREEASVCDDVMLVFHSQSG